VAAAPAFEDGYLCVACRGELPLHTRTCPYRKSLDDSFDAMSGVAAPLLAGFSIAFIGLVIGSAAAFRWPGWTLLPLTMSALLLVTCVQGGFWIRHYRPDVSVDEQHEWTLALPAFKRWLHLTRWTYNAGIALLLLGLALALYPRGTDVQAGLRRLASGLALAAATAEVVWGLLSRRSVLGAPPPRKR
jgi:hypothetical protein